MKQKYYLFTHEMEAVPYCAKLPISKVLLMHSLRNNNFATTTKTT